MRRWCHAFALLIAARHPLAQSPGRFPNKPVRVIASSSAGGISDIFIRIVGEELHKKWGQPLVVENRPGGQFNIGAKACADAAARRLHHLHPSHRRAAVQPLRLPFAELRSVQGSRAGHGAVLPDAGLCGVVVAQRQHAGRARGLFQGASEDAVLFRGGHSASALHRELQGGNRRRHRARAVPRRRRSGQRHADRHDAGRVLRHRQLHPPSAGRHHPRHRGRRAASARRCFPTSRP